MKKLSRNVCSLILFLAALALSMPFINGRGCDAMIRVESKPLGQLYGRCENGYINVTVSHKKTNETYVAKGIYGYLDGQYYIFVINRNVKLKEGAHGILTSSFFYRDIYSGLIMKKDKEMLLLSSSPMPVMWKAKVWGKLGFFE